MTTLAVIFLVLFLVFAGVAAYFYTQVVAVQSQNSDLQSSVGSLQTQVSNLQSTIGSQNSILSLSDSQTEANQVTVNQVAGNYSKVVAFSAQYAGQVKVTGSSTTTTGYVNVTESNGFSQVYTFGTSNTVFINIVPGTVTVYFGNNNAFSGATATLTVVYIY